MSSESATYHHGDLRVTLLQEAVAIIKASGVRGISMRALAERAGVSRSAPYRHFDNKAALLAAVAEEGFNEFTRRLRAAEGGAGPHQELERFRAMGLAYVRFAAEHPARYRLMFGRSAPDREQHPELDAAASAAFDELATALDDCQEAGTVRSEPPARAGLAQAAWSTVHGLAMLIADGQFGTEARGGPGDLPAEQLPALVTGLLWEGLRPQANGGPPETA